MSSHWTIRLSLFTLIGVAMLTYGLVDSACAQKFKKGGAGSAPGPGDALEEEFGKKTKDGDRDSRRSSDRNSSRGDAESTKTSKPRFVNLLDSKDLSEFRGYQQEEIGEGWSLDGKSLYFDGSGGGDIITKEVYENFDLQIEWKVADGANSGIMYRVSLGDDAPYISGPEYQILDDTEHADGKNELTAVGSLYGLVAAKEKTLREVGTWNKTRIIVDGNKITHYLNSKKVLEAEIGSDEWNKQLGESKFKDWKKFAKNSEGHIAFQDHGNEVWFRNIRIKRLASADGGDDDRTADKGDDRDRGDRDSARNRRPTNNDRPSSVGNRSGGGKSNRLSKPGSEPDKGRDRRDPTGPDK